jgi:BirA family biotin operon repressor/biotin-[acetyl-CoA-carboxylase] ligase
MRFDADEFADALAPRKVVALRETSSTNDEARRLAADGALDGTIVVADSQTAGRGRLGRSWWSEPGASLLASWVVRPELAIDRWTIVPLIAGVAVCEALDGMSGAKASLKWPNDVVIGERKLGGILSEAAPGDFVVVGLGLNVMQERFPPDLEGIATSVRVLSTTVPGRPELLAAILDAFDRALREPDAALDRYRGRCATLGKAVRVERSDETTFQGLAREITGAGALVVQSATGPRVVAAGDVVHLR